MDAVTRALVQARRIAEYASAPTVAVARALALVRAQAQKDQLTAFVVHDLKNPLNGIMLNGTVLARDPKLSADAKTTALRIVAGARSMNRMVIDILDVGRSEDGLLVPRRVQVDVSQLLAAATDAVRERAETSEQRIESDLDLAQPTIAVDEDLLRRVIENLLDNALRYTPRGGLVRVEGRSVPAGIEIRVRDGGKGIPAAERERVFEKYVQLDGGQTIANRSGRGLGLLFCRLAVTAHNGRIWIEGEEDAGATFAVSLPLS